MAVVKRICFVCLGNIIRSPLAEHLFAHLADQAGVGGNYQVDSAGTGPWHVGEAPDPRMRRMAARHGLSYSGRARRIQLSDFDRFDLLLAMDRDNRAELVNMAGTPARRQKVRMLREFDPLGGPGAPVPDPYYAGTDGFEEVYQVIERSCRGLLEALEEGKVE